MGTFVLNGGQRGIHGIPLCSFHKQLLPHPGCRASPLRCAPLLDQPRGVTVFVRVAPGGGTARGKTVTPRVDLENEHIFEDLWDSLGVEELLEVAAEGDDVHAPLPTGEDKGSHPSRVPVEAKNASYLVIAAKIPSVGSVGVFTRFRDVFYRLGGCDLQGSW